MFDFFKKTIVQEVGKYSPEIEAIHREFFTASDKLLEEAQGILAEAAKVNTSKIDRLKALGFGRSREVAEKEPVLQRATLTQEQVELVKYYAQEYPLHKFITEEQVKGICQRWGLVCGEVGIYKGFIPEKNLREIERFKLKAREKNTLYGSNGLVFEDAEVRENKWAPGVFHIFKKGETDLHRYAFQSNDGVEFYGPDNKDVFGYKRLPNGVGGRMAPHFASSFTLSNTLQICAPLKDMDLTGKVVKEGYKVEKEIPDPVVLQPVKGGYLILTAWGPEASDPDVVNERMN